MPVWRIAKDCSQLNKTQSFEMRPAFQQGADIVSFD
jgi:hypothetical protein